MCHYITAVLPRSAGHVRLDAIAREHGRQFMRLPNPGIEAQLEADEQYFLTTVGHCDCGTPLGAFARAEDEAPDWLAQEQRLLKKGWSKSKAACAIAQKQEDYRSSLSASAAESSSQLSGWVDFIRSALGPGKASHMGLLLHMYSGPVDSCIELEGRVEIRTSKLTIEVLGSMKEDVLYVFRH